MANRFEETDAVTQSFVESVMNENFPHLRGCQIITIFDTKKRKAGGRFAITKFVKTNDMLRHITADNINPEGADYVMNIDKQVWAVLSERDRLRIIRHTLQHADVDLDKDQPYSIRNPEVSTFYAEIEFNKDDPQWMERIENIADHVYTKEEDRKDG